MTETGYGPGHPLWEDDEPVAETLRDWLVANGVNWDHVTAWPELEVTDELIRVEMIKHGPNGQPEICHGPDHALTHLATFPHAVKVDPEFLAAYHYSRPKALAQRRRDSIERFLLHHPPAVMVGRGQTLVWVTTERASTEELAAIRAHLTEALPDINNVVVSGFDHVIYGPHLRVAG